MSRKAKIFLAALIAVLLTAAVVYGAYRIALGRLCAESEAAEPSASPEPSVSEESRAETESEASESESAPEFVSEVDFESYWAVNPWIYARISIPGTELDYPIVQHPVDDTYYLDHTVEDKAGYPGSIFTFADNATDFSRFNTVIYGHNMLGGSMFGYLYPYADPAFAETHRSVIIDTPESRLTYTVFACVKYDDRLINTFYDDDDPEDRQAFLDSLSGVRDLNSYVLDDVPVDADSHIITLSTCVIGEEDRRFLVVAVLTDVEK